MHSVFDFLSKRLSTRVRDMSGLAPSGQELSDILEVAARVPDHGRLVPFRFIVLSHEDARSLGAIAADVLSRKQSLSEAQLAEEQDRFLRSDLVIGVVHTPREHPKIPASEQLLAAAAATYSLVLAAQSKGYAAQWRTEWVAYDRDIKNALGLAANETMTGFIYMGGASTPVERVRPVMADIVQYGLADMSPTGLNASEPVPEPSRE
mgnify:CR=1 FL=1